MKNPNVAIITTCSENVSEYYKAIARTTAKWLATSNYDLVFGASSKSMMGICYDEFKLHNRQIYAITTNKYKEDLKNIPEALPIICDTTFDMKKEIFQNSDLIVMLPGGVGTFSEFFAFIEEKRSNDKDTPIIIYDEDGYFLPFIEIIKIMQVKQMADIDVDSLYQVAHNKEEFLIALANTYKNERGVK